MGTTTTNRSTHIRKASANFRTGVTGYAMAACLAISALPGQAQTPGGNSITFSPADVAGDELETSRRGNPTTCPHGADSILPLSLLVFPGA